jgi:hypothetical protein
MEPAPKGIGENHDIPTNDSAPDLGACLRPRCRSCDLSLAPALSQRATSDSRMPNGLRNGETCRGRRRARESYLLRCGSVA